MLLVMGQENGLLFSTSSCSSIYCHLLSYCSKKGRSRWVTTFSQCKSLIGRRKKHQRSILKMECKVWLILLIILVYQNPFHIEEDLPLSPILSFISFGKCKRNIFRHNFFLSNLGYCNCFTIIKMTVHGL